MSETIEITRYPNRRLYDRSTGQYVTLQELEGRIRAGQNIEVTDSKTGEDLTRAVLTQMILERHPERMELFPVSFLHRVLRANDLAMDWMRTYLQQSFLMLERLVPSLTPTRPTQSPDRPVESSPVGDADRTPHTTSDFPPDLKPDLPPTMASDLKSFPQAWFEALESSWRMPLMVPSLREFPVVEQSMNETATRTGGDANPGADADSKTQTTTGKDVSDSTATDRDSLLARLEQLEQRLKQLELEKTRSSTKRKK